MACSSISSCENVAWSFFAELLLGRIKQSMLTASWRFEQGQSCPRGDTEVYVRCGLVWHSQMRAEIPIAQFWERRQQGQNELWLFVALCHTEICFLLSLCGDNKLCLFFLFVYFLDTAGQEWTLCKSVFCVLFCFVLFCFFLTYFIFYIIVYYSVYTYFIICS